MNKAIQALLFAGTALALPAVASAADMPVYPQEPAIVESNPWDAYVSVGAGYSWFGLDEAIEDEGISLDDFQAEIRASAAYQFLNGFGLQSDLVFNYQAFDTDDIDLGGLDVLDSVKTFDTAGHAFYRNDSFLLGAFGQYGFTSMDVIGPIGLDVDRFYAGGEAQGYWGNFTLYGQGGYANYDLGIDGIDDIDDIDGFFANGELRYFATPNWKLSVDGGYQSLDLAGLADANTWHVGGGTEYRLDSMPVSLFLDVDYTNTELDIDDGEDFDEVRVLAGLKLNLGTETLIDRDRSGATLNPTKDATVGILGSLVNTIFQ